MLGAPSLYDWRMGKYWSEALQVSWGKIRQPSASYREGGTVPELVDRNTQLA